MSRYLGIFFLLIGCVAVGQSPAGDKERPVLLLNGVAHIGNGKRIERSAIALENGRITWLSRHDLFRGDVSRYEVIDITGKHVYPGLILPNTRVGLEDIMALRPTKDYREVGLINPHVRALVAYNAESALIPTLRFNGILLAQIVPEGGLLSGTSSIMLLDGWRSEDAVYATDEGLHVRWLDPPNAPNKEAAYVERMTQLKEFISHARAYARKSQLRPEDRNVKMEAMRGFFSGKTKLYVHVNHHKAILNALAYFFSEELRHLVLVGAKDALYVADFLRLHQVPVLLDYVHRLPSRDDEAIDAPYRLASELHKKGVLVGIGYQHAYGAARNLPFAAGTAAAYGLDKEEALKLITSNTAKILGIERRAGTLEVGKDAHVVVSKGDILDMRHSRVEMAFIRGRRLALKGKQQELYERYMRRYALSPKY